MVLGINTIPAGVELVRLVPSGHCSTGRDILRQVTAATPRWSQKKRAPCSPEHNARARMPFANARQFVRLIIRSTDRRARTAMAGSTVTSSCM